MTLRWPLVASLAALIAGAALAALVLAFCGDGGGETVVNRSPTRTPSSRTVTRTPKSGTPATTGTPARTPSSLTPSAETATPSGGTEPGETPEAPPPPDETAPPGLEPTLPPGVEPTLAPGETPASSPQPGASGTVGPPTSTPRPTATSTPTPPPTLSDLVLLGMFVSNDQLGVVLGNEGKGEVPAGQEVEFRVRGVVAATVTLAQALPPGASTSIVLENQVIYKPEMVFIVVDPNNLIPEEDDNNNGAAEQLAPDVAQDLAVHGVFRAPDTNQPLVVIRNVTSAPALQVTVVVTVYAGTATEPTTVSTYQLSIEPLGFETVEVVGVAALPGVHMKVVAVMTDPPDANPANNVWEGTIS